MDFFPHAAGRLTMFHQIGGTAQMRMLGTLLVGGLPCSNRACRIIGIGPDVFLVRYFRASLASTLGE